MKINKNNFYNSKHNKTINTVVKGTIISFCIYFGLASSSPTLYEDKSKYTIVERNEKTEEQMLQELYDETGIDINNRNLLILYAVLRNNNLDDNEKDCIYKLSTLICENPYLDIELSYDSLSKLKIEYLGKSDEYDDDTLAVYSNNDNTISVFQIKEETNYEILLHELVHSIFTNDKTIKLPKFLIEGETELLTNEYLSNTPFLEKATYPYEVTMVKLLCEMVGADSVLEAYTTGDLNAINSKLIYDDNYFETTKFLNNIDIIFKALSNNEKIPEKSYNEFIVYMDKFFENNYSNDQEKQELYEYYKGIFNKIYKDDPYTEYNNYINENGIIIKPYYSEQLKNNYPNMERVYLETTTKKLQKCIKNR